MAVTEAMTIQRLQIGGLPTVIATKRQLASMMVVDCLKARRDKQTWLPKVVFSSNGQGVALAATDEKFKAAMLAADWIHADGQSIVVASKLTSRPLPERIATTDFIHDAAEAAVAAGLSFYILGGSSRQNEAAVRTLKSSYPALRIAGNRDGYFGRDEDAAVCDDIRRSQADVLWVGLGKPLQEFWSIENRHRLGGVGWIKTCGGLYAFLSGEAPRAPQWMQDASLEWLFRTCKEPRRLGLRYLVTNPVSIYQLLMNTSRYPI